MYVYACRIYELCVEVDMEKSFMLHAHSILPHNNLYEFFIEFIRSCNFENLRIGKKKKFFHFYSEVVRISIYMLASDKHRRTTRK